MEEYDGRTLATLDVVETYTVDFDELSDRRAICLGAASAGAVE